MKKSIFAALTLAAASPALAQSEQTTQNGDITEKVEYTEDKYKVETNHFWDNWFITVGAGPQMMFGDHDKQVGFGKRISPSLDIAVGKWFTPGVGMRLMYNGLSLRGATRWGAAHSTGEQVPDWGEGMYYSKFKYYNVRADVMFNLSNLFCGYKEKRIWNSSFYAGVGYMRTWEAPTAGNITLSAGWLNSFRLCDALAAINDMRAQLNKLTEENERLQKAIAEGNQKAAEVAVRKVASGSLIVFAMGQSELSNEARVNLGMLAEVIKSSDSNTVYTITGYSDAGTGSKKRNEQLSKERAQAVFDCLTKEFGVSASQLRMDYKGGVDNMFYDDPRLSRAVITRGE